MSHAYVTYFDINYAIKGLTMLDSLHRHEPGCTVTVVCLDDDTFRLLAEFGMEGVRPVPLKLFERGDEKLATARTNRSRVEYYWTLTPTILLHILEDMPQGDVLTYVDADLWFFSTPAPVFEELGTSSVLIHKHNFPPRYAAAAINGVYNVGLMVFRHDSDGLTVLRWWRERCLEWCYDRCEDGKMGDQKYLESFASLTEKLTVSANPGVGVAPWNFSGYQVDEREGVPCVDGTSTVFFHYHSAAYLAPGCLAPCSDLSYQWTQDLLRLYAVPYLDALDEMLERVRRVRPTFAHGFKTTGLNAGMCMVARREQIDAFRKDYPCILSLDENHMLCAAPQLTGYAKLCGSTIRAGGLTWGGDYPDWQSAVEVAGGYDEEGVFRSVRDACRAVRDGKALWERDSVLFHTPEYNWPLLAGLMSVAVQDGGKLHVLDFGGSLGSTYMQHRVPLASLPECVWHVVEQEHFVRCGREEFTTSSLRFHETPEEALAAAPINVILLSGVIHYMEEPYTLLKKMIATGLPIIIDRTPMQENGDRITVQTVPAEIYRASYACRWLDKRRLEWLLRGAGYSLSPWFHSAVDPRGFYGVLALPTRKDGTRQGGEDGAADRAVACQCGGPTACPSVGEDNHEEALPSIREVVRPLRVMQVDDFYTGYLDAFYRARPGLMLKSSAEQGRALLEDGFSAIHVVAPYLDDCQTEYFVSGAKPLQCAWAQEQDIAFPDSPDWEAEMIRRRVEAFRPDVLYIADPVRFDARFLRSLPFKPRLIMGWKAADVPMLTDFRGYDVFLSNVPNILQAAVNMGAAHAEMFYPGVPQWIAQHVELMPHDVDVCFTGSLFSGQHNKRIALLDSVAQAAAGHGFSFALHLSGNPAAFTQAMRPYLRPPVFGLTMHEALRHGRIVLNIGSRVNLISPTGERKTDLGGDDIVNMRLFEATAGGSLLLTETMPGVKRYFDPGSEVLFYQNSTDLVEQILYYLSHVAEREAIAEAGRRRCLDEHCMKNAVRRFMGIVEKYLR